MQLLLSGRLFISALLVLLCIKYHCGPLNPSKKFRFWRKHPRLRRSSPVSLSKLAQQVRRRQLDGGNERQQNRPQLVLHVGPSKTGTTSLQTDLTNFQDQGHLTADNYVYAGRYYHPFYNDKGILQVNKTTSPLLDEARKMLQKGKCTLKPRSKCCEAFKRQLDDYKRRGQNVILSDEAFNHFWTSPADYRAISDALLGEWDVVVVVGYRRFFEWLPSYKYQRDRLDHKHVVWKNAWPGVDGGKPIEPIFPQVFENWRRYFPYTDFAVKNAQDSFSIEVLSLYEKERSTRSDFLCNILVGADTSCKESLFQDMRKAETTMNTRAGTPSFFYDAIATAAAANGLVDTRSSTRHQVAFAIQMHQEEHLNLSALDFDLDCPSAIEMEQFLHSSLELEAKLQPDTFIDTEAEHIDGFREKVEAKTFCWVDTEAVLRRQEWIDFFQERQAS